MQGYLRKTPDIKLCVFITNIIQVNTCLLYFLSDFLGQLVKPPPDDEINKILCHAMPNTTKKNMVEQGYNYLDGPIHSMAEFFTPGLKT